jgi:predicted flap endonuclease-1-like 5' DNA nuclease
MRQTDLRKGPSKGPLNSPRRASTTLLLALLLGWGGAARASHYAVADVPRIITPAQVEKLHHAKVETTEQLFAQAARTKDRKALSKASGLPAAELLGLARRCDLLRIKGVGSEMVLLFEAAGVKSTADLVGAAPAALTAAMDSANKTAKISEKPPTEPQLADWIGQAKKLPPVLESK